MMFGDVSFYAILNNYNVPCPPLKVLPNITGTLCIFIEKTVSAETFCFNFKINLHNFFGTVITGFGRS